MTEMFEIIIDILWAGSLIEVEFILVTFELCLHNIRKAQKIWINLFGIMVETES